MVITLALPNRGQYEFLGGDGQNLLLAAMPGFWGQNLDPNVNQDTVKKLFSKAFY
jgi:hypothetical protein